MSGWCAHGVPYGLGCKCEGCDVTKAKADIHNSRSANDDSLDAAWAAAMAALPAGWEHLAVRLHRDGRHIEYEAAAGPYDDQEQEYAFGRAPADALRELAHRLLPQARENNP